MSSNPINLALRFLLELASITAMAFWGFAHGNGLARLVFAAAVPLAAAMIWGVFAVPGDPSRSGSAPVPVPGMLRLGLEICFFAFAVWCLFDLNRPTLVVLLGSVTAVHYAISYDRIGWLVRA
jgi:hypothetical protein